MSLPPMNVLGVICKNSFFPAFTITVVESAGETFLVYPKSDTPPHEEPCMIKPTGNAADSPHFYPCGATTSADSLQDILSFAFNDKAIVIGTLADIKTTIEIEVENYFSGKSHFNTHNCPHYIDSLREGIESISQQMKLTQ